MVFRPVTVQLQGSLPDHKIYSVVFGSQDLSHLVPLTDTEAGSLQQTQQQNPCILHRDVEESPVPDMPRPHVTV